MEQAWPAPISRLKFSYTGIRLFWFSLITYSVLYSYKRDKDCWILSNLGDTERTDI
jgi:hypothetical protein